MDSPKRRCFSTCMYIRLIPIEKETSLKTLCLKLIAQEYKKFHFAFVTSHDEILKKHFHFLQRKYSFELGSYLLLSRKLKAEYLNFLVNEHLKIFDGQWLQATNYPVTKAILCRLTNLTKIVMYFICNDEILKNIASCCPKIVEINFRQSSVTDNGVKYLCENKNERVLCPELRRVFLIHSEVTEEGGKYLVKNLPLLETIDCDLPEILYSLHKSDLLKIQEVRSYNFIDLNLLHCTSYEYYADLLKICLTVCPKLQSLSCWISEKNQLNFFSNVRLKRLDLKFPSRLRNSKINIDNFLKVNGGELVSLKITNCELSIFDLTNSCHKLKYFRMQEVTVSDKYDLQQIFHSLVQCDFHSQDSSSMDKSMRFLLLNSPNLKILNIEYCVLSFDAKTYILKCCEKHVLEEIFFRKISFGKNFIKDILVNCAPLMKLNMYNCGYSFKERDELSQFAETLPNKPRVHIVR